jgi:hypothetical protein
MAWVIQKPLPLANKMGPGPVGHCGHFLGIIQMDFKSISF